jgi:hypothetical protein
LQAAHAALGRILLFAREPFRSAVALKTLFSKQIQAMVNAVKTAGNRFE